MIQVAGLDSQKSGNLPVGFSFFFHIFKFQVDGIAVCSVFSIDSSIFVIYRMIFIGFN